MNVIKFTLCDKRNISENFESARGKRHVVVTEVKMRNYPCGMKFLRGERVMKEKVEN